MYINACNNLHLNRCEFAIARCHTIKDAAPLQIVDNTLCQAATTGKLNVCNS